MAFSLLPLLKNKCPDCHKGKVFRDKSLFRFSLPNMYDHCSHCGFKFSKEPGFFFGAMYVNYGLNVAQGILTYLVAHPFFTETFDLRIFPIIAIVLFILAPFNIRLSRLLWIYLLKNYAT